MSEPVRTDVHAPRNLVTEHYDYVGYYDHHHSAGLVFSVGQFGQMITTPAPNAAYRARMRELLNSSTEHRQDGKCDHCGTLIRYAAIMLHRPTGQHIEVGEQCLENRFSRATNDFHLMRKQAQLDREQHRIREAIVAFVGEHPDLAWMGNLEASQERVGIGTRERPNYFVLDVSHKLRRYGSISERQVNAVRASLERDAEMDAQRAARQAQWDAEAAARPSAPCPSGRVTVTGEVLTVREPDADAQFPSYKMLVRDDRGFRVWGTVPAALTRVGNHYVSYGSLKGQRVTFTAEVTPKQGEADFGFYSRPTQARTLPQEEPVSPAPTTAPTPEPLSQDERDERRGREILNAPDLDRPLRRARRF